RIAHHVLAAGRNRIHAPGRDVDAPDIRIPFLADRDEDGLPVAAPDRTRRHLTARRALIASETAVDVEVVGGGQILRRPARQIDHPEIRLAVRALGVAAERADERQAFPVWRKREGSNAAVDADDALGFAAAARDGVDVAVARIVVRLTAPIRDEQDLRAVRRPAVIAVGEITGRDLVRGHRFAAGRNRDGPDVRGPIAIDEPRARDAVGAIDGVGDDADVALARLVFRLGSLRRLRLLDVLRLGRRGERDALAVWRPFRTSCALRQ